MKRTDIHRPSAINPEEYTYVGCERIKIEGIGDVFAMAEMRRRIKEHMARTGGTYSRHAHGGNCHVCGNANAMYTILFHHYPTNVYVRMGETCADKMEYSHDEFNAFTAASRDAMQAKAGINKAMAILEDRGLFQAWGIRQTYLDKPFPQFEDGMTPEEEAKVRREHRKQIMDTREAATITDILNKVIKYGDLSDKAADYLKVLIDRVARKPEIEAQRAAEKAAAQPCPTGRVTITGTIVSVKIADELGPYGFVHKMLVKADEGYMVWMTLPGSMSTDTKRNSRIVIKATVTPSNDDNKSGFGKRPMLVSYEEPAAAAVEAQPEEPCHPKADKPMDILQDVAVYLYTENPTAMADVNHPMAQALNIVGRAASELARQMQIAA
jgi:hypothetical protein